MVRRAARLAGFGGTLELRAGPRVDSEDQIWGMFYPPERIVLWTQRNPPVDQFMNFLHELGHHDRYARGKYNPIVSYAKRGQYHHDPEERAAERHAKKLMSMLGLVKK